MTSTTWIERLRSKLATLGARAHHGGTDWHHLCPPLSRSELSAIEAHHSIVLPEEYRLFVTELGNGGTGPGQGLNRFAFVDVDSIVPRLEEPMPWAARFWSSAIVEGLNQCVGGDFPLSGPLLPDDMFEEDGAVSRAEWSEVVHQVREGTWRLAHYGCAIEAFLVVQGDHRGEVWVDDAANSGAVVDFATFWRLWDANGGGRCPRGSTFLDWYEHWIDEVLRGATVGTAARGNPEGDDPDPSGSLRSVRAAREAREAEQEASNDRRARRQARRDQEAPSIRESSRAILEGAPSTKDGTVVSGRCPRCGEETSLRVCHGDLALCFRCYFDW